MKIVIQWESFNLLWAVFKKCYISREQKYVKTYDVIDFSKKKINLEKPATYEVTDFICTNLYAWELPTPITIWKDVR